MPIKLEYAVSYDILDEVKRDCMAAARETDNEMRRRGFAIESWSRGESCLLARHRLGFWLGYTQECLGTMNLAEDARAAENPESDSFFDHVAQTGVAMIVNDIGSSGTRPFVVGMYLAVGDESWFANKRRREKLIIGQKRACILARATWGPGEIPKLQGNVTPKGADLAGSGIGIATERRHIINPKNIRHGDVMVAATGTGLHGNGWTAARDLAKKLRPLHYRTPVPGTGTDYGTLLIQPTPIYSTMVEDIQDLGVSIHYAVNMTGHGWLKLMRAPEPFVYVIECLPTPQPIFTFFQNKTRWPLEKMYRTFNMNAGFVFYVRERAVTKVIAVIKKHGLDGVVIGHIEKRGNKKAIAGEIEFDGSELNIR